MMAELNTKRAPICILLVEDDPKQIHTVWNMLHEKSSFQFQVEVVTHLSVALKRLSAAPFIDVALLDLSLLTHQAETDALGSLHKLAPQTAVVVITELHNEAAGLRALERGAQDYLLKEEIGTRALVRALHYAVERKRVELLIQEQQLRAETLRDTATALSSTLKLEEVLARALADVDGLVDRDGAYVCLVQEDKLTHFVSDGLAEPTQTALEDWHRGLTYLSAFQLYGRARRSQQPVMVNDGPTLRELDLPLQQAVAVLVTPLVNNHQVIGYLTLIRQRGEAFREQDKAVLELFAYQVAAALVNAQHFVQAQETAALQERQQIARDLHDAVSQTLFTASVITQTLPELWKQQPEGMPEQLADLNRLIQGALAELRTLLLQLRPTNLQNTRFTELIRQLITAVQGRKRTTITLNFDGEPDLPSSVHLAAYRIVQESVSNISKHARATQMWIEGRGDAGYVEVRVRDDGLGFPMDSPTAGLGLQMMRERAAEIDASLEITSRVGAGTEVHLIWPKPEKTSALSP
jgi:signal transduction histidine kinase/DNA-binding NarL/FixJ family response regulator